VFLNNLKQRILSSSRLTKSIIVGANDYLFFLVSNLVILFFNLQSVQPIPLELFLVTFISPFVGVLCLYFLGAYRSLVRFIDFTSILELARSLLVIFLIHSLSFIYLDQVQILFSHFLSFKDLLFGWSLAIVFIIGSRLLANSFFSDQLSSSRVLIYGAGLAGIQLASALKFSSEMKPIAFIDTNTSLHHSYVTGLKVFPPESLEKVVKKKGIDELLIAIPSASRSKIQKLLIELESLSIKVRVLPGVEELAQGKVSVSELKEIEVEDLLGRERVEADKKLLEENIKEKSVLVTGAGGSIGSEIARQVLKGNPEKLIILDANEFSLYSIKQELKDKKGEVKIESILGNVTNKLRIKHVCEAFGVQTIYHAAAYKHVPLVEENPFEGVVNNIFGTLNCVQAAIESEVETFVLISTDKAVRPTNIMGATKRFSELILQSLSYEHQDKDKIKITMVRFGNVLGSSGSAIPLFQQQIKTGGPVTVTDPEVIRYFMTISEAAELVIQAGAMGKGGEVFVLNMGEPVKILELAKRMIRLSGMEIKDDQNPEGDIEIIFTGLRPGEKLYEELLIGDNIGSTEHQQIYRANEDFIPWKELDEYLNLIKEAESSSDHTKLRDIFVQTVSGYETEKDIVDVIYLEKSKNS